MTARLGRIPVRLAEPVERISTDLIRKINENVNPPAPVQAGDVYVRAMYVVSDRVNSFGGCFPVDEHGHLADLLVDSPVLAGHRKDKLPLARTFHAITIEHENGRWVKSYFYWLRRADGAASLRNNIDGGLFKECSIGFTFSFAECSICGKDIRLCDHQPFERYEVDGSERECHFNYRNIDRVLETSLVYRGATPDTRVSKELSVVADNTGGDSTVWLTVAHTLMDLPLTERYLILPHYASVPVSLERTGDGVVVERLDGTSPVTGVPDRIATALRRLSFDNGQGWTGRLVGYRGKERCTVEQLEHHLSGRQSTVSRVVLHLVPNSCDSTLTADFGSRDPVRLIPHRLSNRGNLARAAREIMTRSGVEVWPLGETPASGYLLSPEAINDAPADRYQLFSPHDSDGAYLRLHAGDKTICLSLRQFHVGRFLKGARFVGYHVDPVQTAASREQTFLTGAIREIHDVNHALSVVVDGPLAGVLKVRPIRLDGRDCLLVYRCPSRAGAQA